MSKSFDFIRNNLLTCIFGIVIFAIAASSMIFAIVTNAGDETFITRNGNQLHWLTKDLPLSCMYDASVTPEHITQYNAASTYINKATGVNLLSFCEPWIFDGSPMPKRIAGAITLHIGVPPKKEQDGTTVDVKSPFEKHPGASTVHDYDKRNGHIIAVAVWFDPTYKRGLSLRVWVHELGHAIGLAHDRLKSSVMYHTIIERPTKLSARDAKVLQEHYMQ